MRSKFSFKNLISSVSKLVEGDETGTRASQKNSAQKAHDEEIQNAIILLAAEVIRCNRNFTPETEKHITLFLSKHFSPEGVKTKIVAISGHLDLGTGPLLKVACKELKMLTSYDSRLSITEFLFGVAAADDFINPKEIRCIKRIAEYLGLSQNDFNELRQTFVSLNNPYGLLGVEEGTSFEEVKKAYRKMVLKYHPDKQNNKEQAAIKFREIQHAFETIRELKGRE